MLVEAFGIVVEQLPDVVIRCCSRCLAAQRRDHVAGGSVIGPMRQHLPIGADRVVPSVEGQQRVGEIAERIEAARLGSECSPIGLYCLVGAAKPLHRGPEVVEAFGVAWPKHKGPAEGVSRFRKPSLGHQAVPRC